jgi:hypothetical protein
VYTYFSNEFSAVLPAPLDMMFINCRYKSPVAKIMNSTDTKLYIVKLIFFAFELNGHHIKKSVKY